MSKADWRWLLFEYPWAASPPRGWALYADGKAVGFIGAVFSARPLLGRVEKFCNPSSWIVLDEYRYASALLLKPILALKDHTVLSLSLSPAAYKVSLALGLRPLESEQLVLPPMPRPALGFNRGFLVGRPPPLVQRMKVMRLYRPARDDITPMMIDGLYSEYMGLRY